MFTLYCIAFAPSPRPYRIGHLFTHNNSDFGGVSVTERSCPELPLHWRVKYGISFHTIPDRFCADTKTIPDRASIYTYTRTVISARFLCRKGADEPRRSLNWRVTYRIGVHTTSDSFSWRYEKLSGMV